MQLYPFLLLLNKITPKFSSLKPQLPLGVLLGARTLDWTHLCWSLSSTWWLGQLGHPECPHPQAWWLVLAVHVSWASLATCCFLWLTVRDDLRAARTEAAGPHLWVKGTRKASSD